MSDFVEEEIVVLGLDIAKFLFDNIVALDDRGFRSQEFDHW